METLKKNTSLNAILIVVALGIWITVFQNAGIIPTNHRVEVINTVDTHSEVSGDKSNLFISTGISCSMQTIKSNFKYYNIISETKTFLKKPDSTYHNIYLTRESIERPFKFTAGMGFTHILSTDKINCISSISTGLIINNYPFRWIKYSTHDDVFYNSYSKLFFQLRIICTVLDPGISIGFETLVVPGEIPLFNVSLTKVLGIEQLSSLFGKIQTK